MDDSAIATQEQIAEIERRARQSLSIAGEDVAIRRPLHEIVQATLDAAAGKSRHTRRAYATAIALFVDYLDAWRGDLADPDGLHGWRPFVEKEAGGVIHPVTGDTGRARAEYVYSAAPAAVLRLVDAGLLDGFAAHRRAAGDGENTVVARMAAVRSFLAVALRDNVLTQEQATNLGIKPYRTRASHEKTVAGRRLSKAEVRQLRESVDRATLKGKRDLLILDLGLFAGLREGEIASLRMSDFYQDGGRWWLRVRGKGRKRRKVKVHDVLYQSLAAWLQAMGLDWHDDRPLLVSFGKGDLPNLDSRIGATDVARVVAGRGAEARIATAAGRGRLGAHDLRRTFARNAHDNGAALLLIQQILGHESPETTARYIGIDENAEQSAVDFVRY